MLNVLTYSCRMPLNNYMNFNDVEGVYTYSFEAEKKEDCLVCSKKTIPIKFSHDSKLQDVIDHLVESPS